MKSLFLYQLAFLKSANAAENKGKWEHFGTSGVGCIHTALLPNNKLLCFERPHMAPVIIY
jgi:hypothetical protein